LLPDPGTDGADRALHGRAERAPRRLPGLLTGTSTRRHQRGPKPRLDPPSVGDDIDLDGADGDSRHQEPPPGALRGAPLQQLKQAIRAALSELRLLLPWARTGPAHRLRRVRPLALLLGVDADQHPLKASDRVIVRGHQLFELGPAALLRLALIPLLRKLGRCEFVTEGGHGVRL